MFAVIETGGKQYRVEVGSVISTEILPADVGTIVNFDKVLLIGDSSGIVSGSGSVAAEVLDQRKTDKVIVFKKKRRHNYRRKRGHRQNITVMRIKEIAC